MPTFTTPFVEEGPAGPGPLLSRYRLSRGITVLKNDGVYTEHRYPTHEQVVAADAAYIGGYIYEVSEAEAAALLAAGYATEASPATPPTVEDAYRAYLSGGE